MTQNASRFLHRLRRPKRLRCDGPDDRQGVPYTIVELAPSRLFDAGRRAAARSCRLRSLMRRWPCPDRPSAVTSVLHSFSKRLTSRCRRRMCGVRHTKLPQRLNTGTNSTALKSPREGRTSDERPRYRI